MRCWVLLAFTVMLSGLTGQALGVGRTFLSELPIPLGVQIDPETVTDEDLRQIRATGFDFVRFGIRPLVAQRTPVPVDYPQLIGRIRAQGLQGLGTLYGGSGVWGNATNATTAAASPERPFADFVVQTLANDATRLDAYELWNEPDVQRFLAPARLDQFERAMTLACKRIQTAPFRPAVLIGFGVAQVPFRPTHARLQALALRLLKTGCLQQLSVHPYRRQPETVIADYRQLTALVASQGVPHLNLFASEWGYSNAIHLRSEHAQARLLVRTYLANVAAQVSALNLYAWRDRGTNPFAREQNFGLLDFHGQPKEALGALRQTLAVLRGYRFAQYQAEGPLHRLILTNDRTRLFLYWTGGDAARVDARDLPSGPCEWLYLGSEATFSACTHETSGLLLDSRPVVFRVAP